MSFENIVGKGESTCLQDMSFENIVGKGEIVHNEQFLLFPHCFSICLENFLPFSSNLKLSCANSLSLEESKICILERIKVVIAMVATWWVFSVLALVNMRK